MIRITFTASAVCLLLLQGSTAYCQSKALTTSSTDNRVVQLEQQDPETLVSEAGYSEQWPEVNERDVAWRKRIWRTIDTRNDLNAALTDIGTGHANLLAILASGVLENKIKAYSTKDDRFSDKIAAENLKAMLMNNGGKAAGSYDPSQITKYRIKEDWMYIASQKKIVVRIIGIAPVKEVVATDGTVTEKLLFWIYYPEARNYLRDQKINMSTALDTRNVDEYLEKRQFTAAVDKVTNQKSAASVSPAVR